MLCQLKATSSPPGGLTVAAMTAVTASNIRQVIFIPGPPPSPVPLPDESPCGSVLKMIGGTFVRMGQGAEHLVDDIVSRCDWSAGMTMALWPPTAEHKYVNTPARADTRG